MAWRNKDEILIKTPEEIDGIRKSSKLAASILDFIEPYVLPGVTTIELDNMMNVYIKQNGGISACINYHGYPRYTCISVNDVVCHGIPSEKQILKDGDIVNIDVTTIVDGYFGDTSRMYLVGNVSREAKKLVETTKACLDIGIEQIRPGNHFGNIGYEIALYAERLGYSVVRDFTGHGTGVYFHEAPMVFHKAPKNSWEIMVEGMIFTVEPMINLGTYHTKIDQKDGWTARTKDGKLSAQYEHTILVTSDGYEILTVV